MFAYSQPCLRAAVPNEEAALSTGPDSPVTPDVAMTPDAQLRAAVDAALRAFFDERRAVTATVGDEFVRIADMLEQFVLRGGKRIRPLFAWTGWLSGGGEAHGPQADAMIKCSAALELVQACALIHDDIIDSSATRRGFPTVHVAVAANHRRDGWHGDAGHFGISVAILLGDLALAWADDMVRESGLSQESMARIAPIWAAMRTEVLGGQLLDIHSESRGDESLESAMRVNRYKTAAYTVERPLQLGASAAGAPAALIDAFRELGTDLGIAFQLRDDLLGVFGDPAVTGKPSGDDLREGKRTVLLAAALTRADATEPETAELLRASIGADLTDAQVAGLRNVFTSLGAVDEVEAMIDKLTARAEAALAASDANDAAAALLRPMFTTATARTF